MADAGQNFTDMFKKFGEQLKVPSFDMTKIMEHQQKNLEAMTKSWQTMAGGATTGYCATGSLVMARPPRAAMKSATTQAKMGRSMK